MADVVRIRLDLSAGTVDVEAPPESLDSVFEKLGAFIPQLADAYSAFSGGTTDDDESTDEAELDEADDSTGSDTDSSEEPATAASGRSTASRRAEGKAKDKYRETYKSVDLKLDEGQRDKLRQFFSDKSPKGQSDQILTIMYWLDKEGHLPAVNKDEIYTAYRTVDAPVPGRIGSVLSNLRIAGQVVARDDGRYALHHVGEDYVKYKLPKKSK
jgi:hypothetical protein